MRSLARNLVNEERITTTLARAKELRPQIEKMLTLGSRGTLASRRLLISKLGRVAETKKLIEVIAPRYKDRRGGYTRIIKKGARLGDASPMAIIEFV